MSASSASPSDALPKIEPRCRHFGECGGCRLQDLSYEGQLASKRAALEALFAGLWDAPIEVLPSPDVWFYRNKLELSFHRNYDRSPATGRLEPGREVLGFKRRGRWYEALDIEECFLLSPEAPRAVAAARRWAVENKVPVYDSKTRAGLLRQLVLREGKGTGERMAMLLAAPGAWPRESFVEAVSAAYPGATVVAGTNDAISDVAQAQSLETLAGAGRIRERLDVAGRRLEFLVSPFSFFQTNSRGAEALYALARQWVAADPPVVLWDLYGGAGPIGLSAADLAGRVVSVESVASAVEDGRRNAGLNGVSNIEFVEAPVERFVESSERLGAAVVDPPRSGLHPKALRALCERPFERLLYVSCNPKILARECESLSRAYRLESLRAVDLFPHTEHVEAVASFLRR